MIDKQKLCNRFFGLLCQFQNGTISETHFVQVQYRRSSRAFFLLYTFIINFMECRTIFINTTAHLLCQSIFVVDDDSLKDISYLMLFSRIINRVCICVSYIYSTMNTLKCLELVSWLEHILTHDHLYPCSRQSRLPCLLGLYIYILVISVNLPVFYYMFVTFTLKCAILMMVKCAVSPTNDNYVL